MAFPITVFYEARALVQAQKNKMGDHVRIDLDHESIDCTASLSAIEASRLPGRQCNPKNLLHLRSYNGMMTSQVKLRS